jgi:type IV pilus assembly protein PilY1
MKFNRTYIAAASALALATAGIIAVVAAPVFKPNEQPIGYVGQPTPSNINVIGGDAKMYSIDYAAGKWTGNLHSYPISSAGVVSSTDDWAGGASDQIAKQVVTNTRKIVTIKDGAGVEFTWSKLSAGQKTSLDVANATNTSSPMLDYLRGDKTNEGDAADKLRVRTEALGDIIHSTPVVYGEGANATVFVGANDGMMHAIDAVDGSERFAYVPAVLLPRLALLGSQGYSHQYYVDGRLDVHTFGSKTVLVGALGGGGKALYALDVSKVPTSQSDAATKVLWELTNASSGFSNLGDTYGAPTLFPLSDSAPALVVGNGYNNTGTGTAVMYLIHPVTGALIRAYDTGSGSPSSPNGLSSPSLWDGDGDGYKDTAYAGDINGNVWRFMLKSPYTITKLFDSAGASQAITMAPGLSAHPLGGVMVHFVTGRMLTPDDATDPASHYAYGIWDKAPASNLTLLEQVLTEENHVSAGVTTRVRTSTTKAPDWTAGKHRGWRTKLPITGERVVGDGAFVTGGVFQFLSTNPTAAPTGKPPGENWWMQLNALTGGDTGTTQFDLNNDKKFTSADQISGRDAVGRMMGGGVRSQLIGLSANGVDVYHSNFDRNGAPVAPSVKTTTETIEGSRGVSGGHFDTDIFCYVNCGASNYTMETVNSADGRYNKGKESSTVGTTANMKFVHVHEYDDIYDRVGLSMLHPSQDMQRLRKVKANESTTTAVPPDTQTHIDNDTLPGNAVQVSQTKTSGQTSSLVATSYSYTQSAVTKTGPTSVTTPTGVETITTEKYTTFRTMIDSVDKTSKKPYKYNTRTTKHSWETVTTKTVKNFSFKVLVMNQAYSPAVTLTIKDGGAAPMATGYDDLAYKYQNTAGLKVASLPVYDVDKLASLTVSMPLDAFNVRDWGTGVIRTGLHPARYSCTGAGAGSDGPTPGPLGEWRNGALVVQIVDADIADSDIQLNVAGRPDLGYRLKDASFSSKVIAEYLIYWHHPNNLCYGATGWTMKPPEDASKPTAVPGKPAIGSDDPAGEFKPGTGEGSGAPAPVNPAPLVVKNADGTTTTTTVTYTANAAGGYTKTTVVSIQSAAGSGAGDILTGGAVNNEGVINTGGINKNAAQLGRINWRELQK